MSKKQQQVFLIFLVMFIGLLGFGIVIPTLPFIAIRFKASPFVIGLLMASYSSFQFIASPILGRLSDRYGRKPILALSLFGTALGYFLIALANNIYLVFASRIIDGITGGNISVAQAYISDISQGKERTKAMGLIGAAFGLGFVFGPIIGGVLGSYFLSLPYIFAGGLALTNSIFIMIALPETEKKVIRNQVQNNFLNFKLIKEIFKLKIIRKLTLIFFIVTLSFSLLQGMFSLYTKDLFGWNQKQLGYYFSLIGLTMIITQGVIIRKLVEAVDKVGSRRTRGCPRHGSRNRLIGQRIRTNFRRRIVFFKY